LGSRCDLFPLTNVLLFAAVALNCEFLLSSGGSNLKLEDIGGFCAIQIVMIA
jgi:hypothetical protein